MNGLQQLKEAEKAYIIRISEYSRGDRDRFAVYTQKNNDNLEILWCKVPYYESETGKDELFPMQVFYNGKNWNIPGFHFLLTGGQYNKFYKLAEMLKEYNPNIKIYEIGPNVGFAINEIKLH